MTTIIEDLEYQVEYWRGRAEAAEAALRGSAWEHPVKPLTLYQTRVLRLLAERDMTGDQIVGALLNPYEATTPNALKAQLSKIRRVLPASIVPPWAFSGSWGNRGTYTIPDRPALRAFLETGALPEHLEAA